jgi:nitrate reductase beta subunit
MLLYDADQIEETAGKPDTELVDAQRNMILDPSDPNVIRKAQAEGVHDKIIEAAQKSPVYKYVKEWRLALPLHPEFRTIPMLFYVPPLLPVMASIQHGKYRSSHDFFSSLESARLPVKYLAQLLSAGDEETILKVYKKLLAIRIYKRSETVGDIQPEEARLALEESKTTPKEVEAIYRMTSLAAFEERFVIPPFLREMAIESVMDPETRKEEAGTGHIHPPKRGW